MSAEERTSSTGIGLSPALRPAVCGRRAPAPSSPCGRTGWSRWAQDLPAALVYQHASADRDQAARRSCRGWPRASLWL